MSKEKEGRMKFLTSVRSMISADDVRATAKKNTMLKPKTNFYIILLSSTLFSTYVKITPGATKSVNEGVLVP